MNLEQQLDRLVAAGGVLVRYLWRQFLLLGWVGKTAAIFAVLFWSGWILSSLGLRGPARELGSAAWFVLGLLLTALFIRAIWRNYTAPPRR
jgi:hypothetical protein